MISITVTRQTRGRGHLGRFDIRAVWRGWVRRVSRSVVPLHSQRWCSPEDMKSWDPPPPPPPLHLLLLYCVSLRCCLKAETDPLTHTHSEPPSRGPGTRHAMTGRNLLMCVCVCVVAEDTERHHPPTHSFTFTLIMGQKHPIWQSLSVCLNV